MLYSTDIITLAVRRLHKPDNITATFTYPEANWTIPGGIGVKTRRQRGRAEWKLNSRFLQMRFQFGIYCFHRLKGAYPRVDCFLYGSFIKAQITLIIIKPTHSLSLLCIVEKPRLFQFWNSGVFKMCNNKESYKLWNSIRPKAENKLDKIFIWLYRCRS